MKDNKVFQDTINSLQELIDNIKKIIEENRKNDFNHIILQSTSMEQLLDYITNLQEENKQLRENNLSMQEEMCLRWKELDNLQQRIDNAVIDIEMLIEIIQEQPSNDKEADIWLLDKLNGIRKLKELKEEGK